MLPEDAIIPQRNLVSPAPTRFTHELLVDEPYRFDRSRQRDQPDGILPAELRVFGFVNGAVTYRQSSYA